MSTVDQLYIDIVKTLNLTLDEQRLLLNILKNRVLEVSDRHAVNTRAAKRCQVDLYKEARYGACRRLGEMIFEKEMYDAEKTEQDMFENEYFRHTVYVLRPVARVADGQEK